MGLDFLTYFVDVKSAPNLVSSSAISANLGIGLEFCYSFCNHQFFRILLDWKLFLVSLMFQPMFALDFRRGFKLPTKLPKLSLTKEDIYVLAVLLIFAVSLHLCLERLRILI